MAYVRTTSTREMHVDHGLLSGRKPAWYPTKKQVMLIWLFVELIICELQIWGKVDTCIFDWDAYMEQVTHMLPSKEHSWNFHYDELVGDTGPTVYPAMHTWIHAALLRITGWDSRFWTTESPPKKLPGYEERTHKPTLTLAWIHQLYVLIYFCILTIVYYIYDAAELMDSWAGSTLIVVMLSSSRRVRDIVTLGFFNDSFAMLFAYASILLFMHRRPMLACVIFSLGVAVKMNVLLMAPGVLFVLLYHYNFRTTVYGLSLCAAVQLVVGLPFLLVDPLAYITRAFNFGRVFEQQWSVTWNWVPTVIFQNKLLSIGLVVLHLVCLWLLYTRNVNQVAQHSTRSRERVLDAASSPTRSSHALRFRGTKIPAPAAVESRSSNLVVTTWTSSASIILAANFIGVAFARSLHFQFFLWYMHSLPLLMHLAQWPKWSQLPFMVLLELAWSSHPPSIISSFIVSSLHIALVLGLVSWQHTVPLPIVKPKSAV